MPDEVIKGALLFIFWFAVGTYVITYLFEIIRYIVLSCQLKNMRKKRR